MQGLLINKKAELWFYTAIYQTISDFPANRIKMIIDYTILSFFQLLFPLPHPLRIDWTGASLGAYFKHVK